MKADRAEPIPRSLRQWPWKKDVFGWVYHGSPWISLNVHEFAMVQWFGLSWNILNLCPKKHVPNAWSHSSIVCSMGSSLTVCTWAVHHLPKDLADEEDEDMVTKRLWQFYWGASGTKMKGGQHMWQHFGDFWVRALLGSEWNPSGKPHSDCHRLRQQRFFKAVCNSAKALSEREYLSAWTKLSDHPHLTWFIMILLSSTTAGSMRFRVPARLT